MGMRQNIEQGLSEPGGRLGTTDRLRTYGLGVGIGLILSSMVVASWWFRRPTEMPNRQAFTPPKQPATTTPGQPALPRELGTGSGR